MTITSTVHPGTGSRSRFVVALVFFVFFVISFLTNILGPLIPDIIAGFHVSLAMAAVLPFAFFIAYGVMSTAGFAVNTGERRSSWLPPSSRRPSARRVSQRTPAMSWPWVRCS
ncbi:MAG: hypothetical protein U1F35_18340 [Steroidobacteraceae bacterium]